MALNLTELTREWIQYLKNNQIVKNNPDPKTGKLIYRKQPNVQQLIKFLNIKGEFEEEDIRAAIKKVLATGPGYPAPDAEKGLPGADDTQKVLPGKEPGADVSTWKNSEVTPGQKQQQIGQPTQPQQPTQPAQTQGKKRYNTDDAQDVEVKEPGQQKPPSRSWNPFRRRKTNEAFYDRQGSELTEDHIKEIFKVLIAQAEEAKVAKKKAAGAPEQKNPEEVQVEKQEQLNRLKQMIRDTMSPEQRRALWRALNEA